MANADILPPTALKPALSMRSQAIVFALVRTVLTTSIRMVYPFLSVFARGMGVSLTDFSLALTARSIVGAFTPLLSPIADRYGRKTGILLGIGMFVAGSLVIIWLPSFAMVIFSLSISFLGMMLVIISMQAYLGDEVPYEKRGALVAITEMGWSLGFIVGMPLVGVLIASYGWRSPFPALAGLGVLSFVIISRMIPTTPPKKAEPGNHWKSLQRVFTSAPALAALAVGLCFSVSNEVVALVFGVWLEDSFGLSILALGAASAVIGFSELAGCGLTAWLVDRLGKERSIRIGLITNSIFALLLPWLGGNQWSALAGLFFFYLTFEFTIVSSLPLLTEVLPSHRGTLMGVNIAVYSLGRALGAFFAPQFYLIGFFTNTIAAAVFNLLAILALSRVRLDSADEEQRMVYSQIN